MNNKLKYIDIIVNQDIADIVSNELLNHGAYSVSVEDHDLDTVHENPIFVSHDQNEPAYWNQNKIIALVDEHFDIQSILTKLTATHHWNTSPSFEIRPYIDKNWILETQKSFQKQFIGESICIVPSWDKDHLNDDKTNIFLDPGMAFGTGTHPTTRLCLEWIEKNPSKTKTFLDYGTGSGILAIFAAMTGYQNVTGVDIDPQSLIDAQNNSDKNNISVKFKKYDESHETKYNVIMANILMRPLLELKTTFLELIHPKGELILSGLLKSQTQDIIDHYEDSFIQRDLTEQGDWALIHLCRKY